LGDRISETTESGAQIRVSRGAIVKTFLSLSMPQALRVGEYEYRVRDIHNSIRDLTLAIKAAWKTARRKRCHLNAKKTSPKLFNLNNFAHK